MKVVTSAFISAALVAVFVVGITIYGELYTPLKDWLKVNFSHHWVGKSVLSAILFLALFISFLFKTPNGKFPNFSFKARLLVGDNFIRRNFVFYLSMRYHWRINFKF